MYIYIYIYIYMYIYMYTYVHVPATSSPDSELCICIASTIRSMPPAAAILTFTVRVLQSVLQCVLQNVCCSASCWNLMISFFLFSSELTGDKSCHSGIIVVWNVHRTQKHRCCTLQKSPIFQQKRPMFIYAGIIVAWNVHQTQKHDGCCTASWSVFLLERISFSFSVSWLIRSSTLVASTLILRSSVHQFCAATLQHSSCTAQKSPIF